MKTECVALIVAAGRGTRFGGDVPKQYSRLGGQPLLRHTLDAFIGHPRIDAVRVVIHPEDIGLYEDATRDLDLLLPVEGGAERQESVRRGLESLSPLQPHTVAIHDAARPFVSADIIDRVIAAIEHDAGAIPAVPVPDTLKRADRGRVIETVARTGLWQAQTPQAFRFLDILAAHRAADRADFTDDAAIAEHAGLAVAIVEGSADNFKVTNADDLQRAERLLAARGGDVRVGNGFDVHRFGAGDHLWLCGVRLAHERGLIGHSDADVALHALTDALLGAAGEGDIGVFFPPSEARWKGAASDQFLRHAAQLIRRRKGVIVHVDVTIICEQPRIGPHRAAMIAMIAETLAIEPGRVSVKATTTEGLGFAGRGEGIAAQATATLRMPG